MAEAGKDGPLQIQTDPEDGLDVWTDLSARFTDIRPLGFGGGGLVYSAKDQQTSRKVSIKKVALLDHTRWRQVLREIKILKRLKQENIITLHEVLDATGTDLKLTSVGQPNLANVKSIFFIQELMDTNLKYLIDSKQLSAAHVRLLIFQLLRGLRYLHAANVLHRDLKPANLFVNCDTVLLKIGDFGTSRIVDPDYDHSGHLTANVGTCWYRSPESILTPTDYTIATDVWSAGCVMAHCLLGRPLFAGMHDLDQVLHIIDTVDLTETDWSRVFKVMPNKLLKNHPFRPRNPLRTRLLGVEQKALDLLESMLAFDASSRCSAEEALKHPYFEIYSGVHDEPILASPFHIEHEVDSIPVGGLQSLLVSDAVPQSNTDNVNSQPFSSAVKIDKPAAENTHTLEEIFQAPFHSPESMPRHSATAARDTTAAARNIVKSKNERNKTFGIGVETATMDQAAIERKRNAENSMRRDSKIRQPGQEGRGRADVVIEKKQQLNVRKKEDEEKDIADCSPSKLREDLELGISQIMSKAQALALNVEHLEQANNNSMNRVHINTNATEEFLVVEVEDTENYKEFSQPSPKELSPNDPGYNDSRHSELQRQANHRLGGAVGDARDSRKPQNDDKDVNKEEYHKKRRLKEETQATISRKLILDKIETEKKPHHASLSSEEFDELYRLPTDHLAINRDLSNQRLKHRTIMARNPLQHHNYQYQRHRKQDLSERYSEDKRYHVAEGACGGYERSPDASDHSETDDLIQTILGDSVIQPHSVSSQRGPGYDIDISLDVLPAANVNPPVVASRDPLSSPESPPSPGGGRSGARPKKSPKKQRAL